MRRPHRSSTRPRADARSTDRSQTLTALAVNSTTSLVAGLTLGALTGTFDRLPGLLVLVPAAIGLRGNVCGARAGSIRHPRWPNGLGADCLDELAQNSVAIATESGARTGAGHPE